MTIRTMSPGQGNQTAGRFGTGLERRLLRKRRAISWELDPRRLNAEGMESLKAILERHKGNTEMQLAFCLDGTFCRVRLGPQ